MWNRGVPSVSHISQTHLDLVSSQCDSGVSQVPPCQVPVCARGWDKARSYFATIVNNQRTSVECSPSKFRKDPAPERLCVEAEAFDYSGSGPNVSEQRVSERSGDSEVEEINFILDQESLNDPNNTDAVNCSQSDIDESISILEFNASDLQWENELDESLYEGSYGFGPAHGSIRGDCLDARVLNPDLIQSALEKRYTNMSYHDDQKRKQIDKLQSKSLDLKKKKAKNLKEFQIKYPIPPGSVPKPPANRANFSHLSTTGNPIRGPDKRISMTEELNTKCTNMERERIRDRAEEKLLEIFDQQIEEFGKAVCEADLKGQEYPNEPQKCSPHSRQHPHILVTSPSVDLAVGATTPVENDKYLSINSGVNFMAGSRLPRNPDEVICNEDQNIPVDSCSTLNETFRNDANSVCDLTYTIADSPLPGHVAIPGTSNTGIEEENCSSDDDSEKIWPYGESTDIPAQACLGKSPKHSKGSPVDRTSICPRDASPRQYPAQVRGTTNRPEAASARPRFPEIYQQVQKFFYNQKEPPTGRGAHMRSRVRFEKPPPKVAEPVCPRARGIVPEDIIQTGVYYCGINNVCQANDPPCVPQRERGSPPPSKPPPSKPPPGKLPPSNRPPIKCPPPGKPPTPPGPRAGVDPRRSCRIRPRLPKVTRPLTEPKPKKKKDFKLTEEQKALVLDNYYPGLIHDAVNQNADFNEVARKFITPESAVDGDKAEKGMSLLEAFDTRVKFEQISLKSLLTTTSTNGNKMKNAPPPYQQTHGASANPTTHDIICEDNVRPTAIVDLQQFVRSVPESDPVRAIACLTRAQHLNDYYKEYRAAQLAAQSAPPDKIEQAALFGVRSFQIQSLSSETETVHSECYKSLELVSYVGVTKPN